MAKPRKITVSTKEELKQQTEKHLEKGWTISSQTEESALMAGSNQGIVGSTIFGVAGMLSILFVPILGGSLILIAILNHVLAGKKQIYLTIEP